MFLAIAFQRAIDRLTIAGNPKGRNSLFCDNLAVVVAAISDVVVAVTLSPAPQQKSKKNKKGD